MFNIILFIIIYILIFIILNILLNMNINNYYMFLNNKYTDYLYDHSYIGMKKKLLEVDCEYSLRSYIFNSIVLGTITIVLVYLSTNTIVYAIILGLLLIFILPYYKYINAYRLYKQHIEENILIYVSTCILFIQERKNSLKILKDCKDLLQDPVRNVVDNATTYIEDTANYELGIDKIEYTYNSPSITKVHTLLKSYKKDGGYNKNLYEYIYQNIEDLELSINEYRIKKQANRNVFYIMVGINLLSVLLFKKMFNNQSLDLNSPSFNLSVFIFYIFNILTVFYYERKCNKEKGYY